MLQESHLWKALLKNIPISHEAIARPKYFVSLVKKLLLLENRLLSEKIRFIWVWLRWRVNGFDIPIWNRKWYDTCSKVPYSHPSTLLPACWSFWSAFSRHHLENCKVNFLFGKCDQRESKVLFPAYPRTSKSGNLGKKINKVAQRLET